MATILCVVEQLIQLVDLLLEAVCSRGRLAKAVGGIRVVGVLLVFLATFHGRDHGLMLFVGLFKLNADLFELDFNKLEFLLLESLLFVTLMELLRKLFFDLS